MGAGEGPQVSPSLAQALPGPRPTFLGTDLDGIWPRPSGPRFLWLHQLDMLEASLAGQLWDVSHPWKQGRGSWEGAREAPAPAPCPPPRHECPLCPLPETQAELQIALPSLKAPGRTHTRAGLGR